MTNAKWFHSSIFNFNNKDYFGSPVINIFFRYRIVHSMPVNVFSGNNQHMSGAKKLFFRCHNGVSGAKKNFLSYYDGVIVTKKNFLSYYHPVSGAKKKSNKRI